MKKNKVNEPLTSYKKPSSFDEVWKLFEKTDKELSRRFKETDKKIKELANLFTTQWGKLVESLVEGELIRLLSDRGIKVESVLQRRRGARNGINYEFDLIAVNTEQIVIVEVKTTLRPDDVKDFIKKLKMAKVFMPEYKQMKIYGAVAFLTANAGSEQMAGKQGLFVIRATGGSSRIINSDDFEPAVF